MISSCIRCLRWKHHRSVPTLVLITLGVVGLPSSAGAQWYPWDSTGFFTNETNNYSEDGNYTVSWWLHTYSTSQEVEIVSGTLSTRTNGTGSWTSIGSVPYTTVWGYDWYQYDKNESGKSNGTYNYWMSATVYDYWDYSYHYIDDYFDVTVAPPPEPYAAQLEYKYEVRTGDFDGNGYIDVLVDRLTPAFPDGSMQTVIVTGHANGPSVGVPNSTELATARAYPINPNVEVSLSDYNFDGYADILLGGLLGFPAYDWDCLILYASGRRGVVQPLGHQFVDNNFTKFFGDFVQAMIDPSYYSDNTYVEYAPQFDIYYGCGYLIHASVWDCDLTVGFSGYEYQVVGIGYHYMAPEATDAYDRIGNDDLSGGDAWKQLSDALENVLGVPSFGFHANGSRSRTNYDSDATEAEEALELQWRFMRWLRDLAEQEDIDPDDWVRHEYDVDTPLCSPSFNTQFEILVPKGNLPAEVRTFPIPKEVCTLENVFCWQKRNPAPRQNGSESTVNDRDEVTLDGGNPIRVHVFDPQRVTVNETLDGHVLHDPQQSLNCARSEDWSDINQNFQRCAYVHRQAGLQADGWIHMKTHGEGHNPTEFWKRLNEVGGRDIFNDVDRWIRYKLATEGDCTDD